ncbi:hypothetical protein ACET3Z_025534 [Daucus carota]
MTGIVDNCSIDNLGLENEKEKASNALLGRGWSPGWSNADKALSAFVEENLIDYSKERATVAACRDTTSLFSPYLHFGEMSVRRVFQEYSRYICFNYPFTHERSLLSNLKYFPWQADQAHFKAWRQGRTGYPLVDAGSLPDGHKLERLDSPQVQGLNLIQRVNIKRTPHCSLSAEQLDLCCMFMLWMPVTLLAR